MPAPTKPAAKEEEYFARLEFERRQQRLHEEHLEMKAKQKKELKALHFMHCPKCGMELVEIDFKGVKIDKCSECNGIWLDNGELDQLLEPQNKGLFGRFLKTFKD